MATVPDRRELHQQKLLSVPGVFSIVNRSDQTKASPGLWLDS
ncbi:MAG: hypothetical protein WCJ09_10150 [Planctomycetota bacterium]